MTRGTTVKNSTNSYVESDWYIFVPPIIGEGDLEEEYYKYQGYTDLAKVQHKGKTYFEGRSDVGDCQNSPKVETWIIGESHGQG